MEEKFPYDDIVNLPHPTSKKHPRMSMEERAAQFSPFAALTGFGAVIQETGGSPVAGGALRTATSAGWRSSSPGSRSTRGNTQRLPSPTFSPMSGRRGESMPPSPAA